MNDWITEYEKFKSDTTWSPTQLKPDEELRFQQWLPTTRLFQRIKEAIAAEQNLRPSQLENAKVINMLLEDGDYDYRGAYKYGIEEQISPHDGFPHWSSRANNGKMLKSPTHETTWKEYFFQATQQDPDNLGLNTYEKAVEWYQGGMTE